MLNNYHVIKSLFALMSTRLRSHLQKNEELFLFLVYDVA